MRFDVQPLHASSSTPSSPASSSTPASSATPAPGGSLAHTGTSSVTWLAIGIALLLAGVGSVSAARLVRSRRH
ncbi:LPXTG cell wall anchor domain-containing protein [Actinacidiphila soli]|uniref:LPXTG cell wall anchor domain-containing protein n=1 Tax=Actinacidiphila soli TaxID=2487275 RepID=UPI000FCB778B|nr:LPXTG cell wall anchor domain-containing protein [Actinacidiphila soli]